MQHKKYWITITALCLLTFCQAKASTIDLHQQQQVLTIPQTNPKIKTTTKLLPIGDALVFASIGSGLVIWMRKQKKI